MSRAASAAALAAAMALSPGACSRRASRAYADCLKLRLGMTREELLRAMGPPDELFPYREGVSLPHLKGRTAYEWANPAALPGPNHASVDDATGRVESVRCANAVISARVFAEPPPAAPEPGPGRPAAPAPAAAADALERLLARARPLRPAGSAGGDAGGAWREYLAGPAGEPGAPEALSAEAAGLLERAAAGDFLPPAPPAAAPEDLLSRRARLSEGARRAQAHWMALVEKAAGSGRHAEAEEAARRLLWLGALLASDWDPGARAHGASGLAAGADLLQRVLRLSGRRAHPDLAAAGALVAAAGDAALRPQEEEEIARRALDRRGLAGLGRAWEAPGGRRRYLEAILSAAALRWSPEELSSRSPWAEREALLAKAERDPEPHAAALGAAYRRLFESYRADLASGRADRLGRWRGLAP